MTHLLSLTVKCISFSFFFALIIHLVCFSSCFSFYLSTCLSRLGRTFPQGCQERRAGESPGEAVMLVIKDHLKKSPGIKEEMNKLKEEQKLEFYLRAFSYRSSTTAAKRLTLHSFG